LARVNHKYIKKLIAQKVKTITDRQFFTSPAVSAHFADIIAAQTRRYHFARRVKVNIIWKTRQLDLIGVTNNDTILVNAGHPIITKSNKDRPNRYIAIAGVIAHELGHILYSDFLMLQTYAQRLDAKVWYPEKPLLLTADARNNEIDIWNYCNESTRKKEVFIQIALQINNSIEDGYIESRVLDKYPGTLGTSLQHFRDLHFSKCPTLTECIEAEKEPGGHIWLTLLQLILSYVLWGELKYGEEPISDERVQLIFFMLPILDQALINSSAKERFNVTNMIIVRCWPYIRSFLEMVENLTVTTGDTINEKLSEILSQLVGTSAEGTGESTPIFEMPGTSHAPSASASRLETTQKAIEYGSIESEDKTEEQPNTEGVAQDESEPETNNSTQKPQEEPKEQQDITPEEGGRIPYNQTRDLSVPVGRSITKEDYEGINYTKAASDIDRLLEQTAEKVITSDLEKQRIEELNALACEIAYGDIHTGVNMKIRRIPEVSDTLKEQYQAASPELIKISKKLQKTIYQQLKENRRGGKQTNLYSGRKLHIHALPRNDGKVFYNKKLPNETTDLAVALLLDESGSMGQCDRATYARATAIIIYDFCRSLAIPITVYGHSTDHSGVALYSYAEYESIDEDDKYRMMDISARMSNRDGAALRYVMERLSKRPEDIKLLILVSDGQPADSGYSGSAAEADLRGIKKDCERKNIFLVAAAIGNDKANIERIYNDSFMDITDLSKMPQKLTDVIKRHMHF